MRHAHLPFQNEIFLAIHLKSGSCDEVFNIFLDIYLTIPMPRNCIVISCHDKLCIKNSYVFQSKKYIRLHHYKTIQYNNTLRLHTEHS